MTATAGWTTVAREVEATLRAGLGLRALPLAPALAHMRGSWRDGPAVLTTRAYVGERVRYARVAALADAGLDVGLLTKIFGRARADRHARVVLFPAEVSS